MKKYIIALDQGTTSTKALLFDKQCKLISKKQQEITQYYPKPGWVEHNPEELFQSSFNVISNLIKESGIEVKDIAAIGITNQRETTVVWDRYTGKPVCNAIVWQCRRSADMCERIKQTDLFSYIRVNTGLVTDAYFSATKIKWILDNVEGVMERALKGDLMFGTVDSWLLYNFTKGNHLTDSTNASRTMLYNLKTLSWDEKLLHEFNIPINMLPDVQPSGSVFGETSLFGYPITIAAMAGDQQASLFGQTCFEPGEMKNTYGTGCFLLVNTGDEMYLSNRGMITTLASEVGLINRYAIEGSVFTGGSVVQWLRDELGLISSSAQSEEYALKVDDTNGVVFVPAFTGLGAPYWDMNARGTMFGLTRGADKCHIVRAALESIAYQCCDVIDSIFGDIGIQPSELKVDGGASNNGFLMQFQSDITNMEIIRPEITETTGFGAAILAGLTVGFYTSKDEIREKYRIDKRFVPIINEDMRFDLKNRWKRAVNCVTGFYK